jgi:hypothetical protein
MARLSHWGFYRYESGTLQVLPQRFRFDRVSQMAATDKTEILWPDPEHGPYLIRLEVTELNGRLECTAVEMQTLFHRPTTAKQWKAMQTGEPVERSAQAMRQPTPVTASALRSVPLGKLVNEFLERLRKDPRSASHRLVSGTADDFREAADKLGSRHTESEAEAIQQLASEPRRGGRKGHGDRHYAAVAEVYAIAWAGGGHPTKAVAEHWSVAKTTAAKWVLRARELGFLQPTTRGRPGGVPHVEGDTK